MFAPPEGWDALAPAVFRPARPRLQLVLERALGLLREDSRRVISGEKSASAMALSITERYARRAKLAEQVRARAMAAEDAWERLAPRAWLGDDRRWLVAEKRAPDAKHDGPALSAAWASWELRREPSSLDYVTTLCADPENVALAEEHAIEACRRMSAWGVRSPERFVWLAEESARFHSYRGARPFRERADETLGLSFADRPDVLPRHVKLPTEAELAAKRDLVRANAWEKRAGVLGPNPFAPILEIWRRGYALSAVLDDMIVLVASAAKLEDLLDPLVE